MDMGRFKVHVLSCNVFIVALCAGDRSRTCTSLLTHGPKPCASAIPPPRLVQVSFTFRKPLSLFAFRFATSPLKIASNFGRDKQHYSSEATKYRRLKEAHQFSP